MILQVELGIGCSHVELVGFWLAFSYLGQYDNSVYLIGIFMFFHRHVRLADGISTERWQTKLDHGCLSKTISTQGNADWVWVTKSIFGILAFRKDL